MLRIVVLLLGLVFASQSLAAIWTITYPRPLTEADQRTRYPVKLLALAMQQTGVKYQLVPTQEILLQDRALLQLSENRSVNVVWSMTDTDRETRLLPIRVPIFKGLIGWRVFMLRDNLLEPFKGIQTLQQLQKYRPIQGADWPDTKILQSNGFDVITSKSYLGLFSILANGGGDFLPRSMVEVWAEMDSEQIEPNVVVEPTLGIRYPTAMYFFVNRSNKTLARLLTDGLEKAIANGSFDELFMQEFSEVLEKTNMKERFFFQLENPLLPVSTPISRDELWYR